MSAVLDEPLLYSPKRPPASHRLLQPILLPITPVTDRIAYWFDQLGFHPTKSARIRADLTEAILHHYFTDAEGRRWEHEIDRIGRIKFLSSEDDLRLELLNILHRLIQNTTGPLMPSYIYQYQVERDTLILTPTLPTIENYEHRIHALSDPDEGWVPARQRR